MVVMVHFWARLGLQRLVYNKPDIAQTQKKPALRAGFFIGLLLTRAKIKGRGRSPPAFQCQHPSREESKEASEHHR